MKVMKAAVAIISSLIVCAVNLNAMEPTFADGVNWLEESQDPSGLWCVDKETPFRDATEAVKILRELGADQSVVGLGESALYGYDTDNVDYMSRKVEALATGGYYLEEEVNQIVAAQDRWYDGGWGYKKGYASDVVDASLALRALRAAGYNDTTDVYAYGLTYLLNMQNPDGGWGFVYGDSSWIFYAAHALLTLEAFADTFNLNSYIHNGVTWLESRIHPDGGFGSSPSNVYETALALMAIVRHDPSSPAVNPARAYLESTQFPDGSWNDDAYSTALALAAFEDFNPLGTFSLVSPLEEDTLSGPYSFDWGDVSSSALYDTIYYSLYLCDHDFFDADSTVVVDSLTASQYTTDNLDGQARFLPNRSNVLSGHPLTCVPWSRSEMDRGNAMTKRSAAPINGALDDNWDRYYWKVKAYNAKGGYLRWSDETWTFLAPAEEIDPCPTGKGDVNGGGTVTMSDALCIFKRFLYNDPTWTRQDLAECACDCSEWAADVNCSGGVSVQDAICAAWRSLKGIWYDPQPGDNCGCGGISVMKKSSKLVGVTLGSAETVGGQRLTVPVIVEDPRGLDAFGLKVNYPVELVEFVGARASLATETWVVDGVQAEEGVVTVGGFHTVPLNLDGQVTLVEMVFVAREGVHGTGHIDIVGLTDDMEGAEFAGAMLRVQTVPTAYDLGQNYPNPFNPTTAINYQIPMAESQAVVHTTLKVYNTLGQEVARLVDEAMEPGYHSVTWDASEMSSGVYFYRLTSGGFTATRQMVLIR